LTSRYQRRTLVYKEGIPVNEEAKCRVILVDDQQGVRIWLKAMLIKLGCEVVGEGENGHDAVELFKAERPHLVLLDLHMPEVDGRMALSHIMSEDPDAYVVILTSIHGTREMLDRLDAGAKYYLLKDRPPKEIEAVLREQIEKAMQ
jgi:two-component system chemotaxis response regulator CheY